MDDIHMIGAPISVEDELLNWESDVKNTSNHGSVTKLESIFTIPTSRTDTKKRKSVSSDTKETSETQHVRPEREHKTPFKTSSSIYIKKDITPILSNSVNNIDVEPLKTKVDMDNNTIQNLQDKFDSVDKDYVNTENEPWNFKVFEYWLCNNFVCPLCGNELKMFKKHNFACVDLTCTNLHLFQVKASEGDVYFKQDNYVTISPAIINLYLHRQLANSIHAKYVPNYICISCIKNESNSTFSIIKEKSFILLKKDVSSPSPFYKVNDNGSYMGKPYITWNNDMIETRNLDTLPWKQGKTHTWIVNFASFEQWYQLRGGATVLKKMYVYLKGLLV